MARHIDIDDPKYRDAAAQILSRHDNFQPEANITSAVPDFLILTGLARSKEIVEENPPSDASRRAVDLTALDTFIEFKRRFGTTTGGEPNPENVRQLDDYLAQSQEKGRVRMGILTDGRRWLLRWPGPSRDISNASAAEMYLPTVSFDRPVPDAMWRRLLPACQHRMTSDISTLSTSL